MVERKNFQLPMALGLFRTEEEGGDPEEVGFLPQHEVHTDLQEVFEWADFDGWVGRTLDSRVGDRDVWSLEFLNVVPPDFVINIANQADLDEALADIVFRLVLFVLGLVGLPDYRFADPLLSRIGVGDFDFCFTHAAGHDRRRPRPLFVVQTLSPWDSPELADPDALDANYLQRLYGCLVFNHVAYGVATSYTATRFVRLAGPGRLLVSAPFAWNRVAGHTVIGALVALALHCAGGAGGVPPAPFLPRAAQFVPVFRRGRVAGAVRWRMDDRSLARKQNGAYFVARGQFRPPASRDHEQQQQLLLPVVVKCFDKRHCSARQLHLLAWEKEMYDRVRAHQDVLFPRCLAQGSVWDMLGVLVLGYAGRPLTPRLMRLIPHLGRKLLAPVRVLHSLDLVHGDIQLRNFVVDRQLNVRLVSLNRCVYTGATRAKVDEMIQVRNLIRLGMLEKRRARFRRPPKHARLWRRHKRRSIIAGWKRYSHLYVKLRDGSFIRAVRKSSIL